MNRILKYVAIILIVMSGCTNHNQLQTGKDYPAYGGNNAGNRFSPLDQITLENVKNLQIAWKYNAADSGRNKRIECQPIVIDGILYGTSPDLKLFALNAATGEKLWEFNPSATLVGYNSANRGVNYWADGEDKRILYCAGSNMYAVNVKTGKLVNSFGKNGKIDFHIGLSTGYYDAEDMAITATSPGVIYKNILVIGSTVSEGGDALPGYIRGFDVRTGKLLWVFHTIPQPGEPGYDTWPKDAYKKVGGANCWSGMVLDEKSGLVYLGTGAPSPNFYGGNRAGKNLFSDCILALDAETGKMKWYYQTIHHDLWDYDVSCPPNLITVEHDGKKVEAVAQTTKDGLIYVLDRKTGISLFPVEERTVPEGELVGEQSWPTQKFPIKPLPLNRQVITDADIPDSGNFPEGYDLFKQHFLKDSMGLKYAPPSIQGTIAIGISGGASWGGNAVDPAGGILYQNVGEVPWEVKMTDLASSLKKSTSEGDVLYITDCAACHGEERKGSGTEFPSLVNIGTKMSGIQIRTLLNSGRGRMPSFQSISENDKTRIINFLLNKEPNDKKIENEHSLAVIAPSTRTKDFPYIPPYISRNRTLTANGYPAIKPPWGTLNAIDLNTGDYLWKVPLGEYPELTKRGIPITGTPNQGGPLVTAGGLVFIAGTSDGRIRAFDKKTGETVWEYQLPAEARATPITYEVKGRQYVVIATSGGIGRGEGGNKLGGWYIAFALPKKE